MVSALKIRYMLNDLKWFSQALFPRKCVTCRKEGAWLCSAHQHLPVLVANSPTTTFKYVDQFWARTDYDHPTARALVHYLKFKQFRGLAPLLALEIETLIPPEFLEGYTVVPIPLHWTRSWQRGFNQSALIARHWQQKNKHLKISPLLQRTQKTQQQANLGKKSRIQNMRGVFEIKQGKKIPQKVILLDDVCSTGATLDAAAKALKKAGVLEVRAVVFAVNN